MPPALVAPPADGASPFAAPAAWLLHLIGSPSHLAVGTKLTDGKKSYFPTAITSVAEISELAKAHVSGHLPARVCIRKGGETFVVESSFGIGYYTVRPIGDRFVTSSLTFDVDGPGHADGLTAEQVEALTWAIAAVAEEAGLAPTVVRSNSGKGRHVIVTFPGEIDAGLAVFIGEAVIAMVPGAEKTEIFPRAARLRDGQLGRLVALPLSGAATGPDGGRIIDRAGNEVGVEMVRFADAAAVAALEVLWKRQVAADATIRAARAAEGKMLASMAHAASADSTWTTVTLEQVVRAHAEVADDRETESDIIGIRCPTHGGTCFHVNSDVGWFFCHKCLHKGAGPGAPYMLLKLLKPDWTAKQLNAELKKLGEQTDAGMGTQP